MGNDQSQDQTDRRVRFADDDYDDYDNRRPRDYPDDDRYPQRHPDRQPRDYPDNDRGRRYPDDDRGRRYPDDDRSNRYPPNDNRNNRYPPPNDNRNNRYPDYKDQPRHRRSPSLDSYDEGSPTGSRAREGTGVSLGRQIRDRARQNQPRTPSPSPRLPSPPRRNRSPPPSPPRFDTPPRRTPPRDHSPPPRPPTRAVPVPETTHSPRRPKPDQYVPTIIESPRSDASRHGRRLTPPMTPIEERSHNGYRDPADENDHAPKQQPSPRRSRQGPTAKPQMSEDLWGVVRDPDPEPDHQEVIYQYYNPHDPHALQRYTPAPRVPVQRPAQQQHPQYVSQDPHAQFTVHHPINHYRKPKTKPSKPKKQPPQTTLDDKRRFQENVMGSFYGGVQPPRRRTQSLRGDDESSVNTEVSLASEGSPWRRRARKTQAQAVVDAENAEVNAYHLLGHGSSSSHPYFSQNVAVTVIKSPRRQTNDTGQPKQQQQQRQEQQYPPQQPHQQQHPEQRQQPPYQPQRQQQPPYQPHRQQHPLQEEEDYRDSEDD